MKGEKRRRALARGSVVLVVGDAGVARAELAPCVTSEGVTSVAG